MSFLGYDPGRLSALRRRLDELADEADGLGRRFDDNAAAEAGDSYRRAVRLMTEWRRDLAAIASCAFGSPFRPVALDALDADFVDVLRPGDAAWTTVTDPRSGLIVSAEDHARHLAEALATGRYRVEAITPALTAALATASTRDVLLIALGPERFAAVIENLARSIARGGAHGAEAAERAVAALAAGFGAAHRAGTIDQPAWERELTDDTDPYATALVLGHAGLTGDVLTRLAKAAWDRWRAAPNVGIDSGVGPSSQALPLVVKALATDPLAARAFVEHLTDDDLWSLFGGIDVPPRLVAPLLLASSDPRSGSPADVERSMLAVLRFIHEHGNQALMASEVYDCLGAYAGPYVEYLLGADDGSGYPYTRWSISEDEAGAIVHGVARNRTAAAGLLVFVDAIVVTRFAQFISAGPVDGPVIDHLGALAGRVDRLVADAHLEVAKDQTVVWNWAWGVLVGRVGTTILTAALPGNVVTSALITNAVSSGIAELGKIWQENGWLGAPESLDDVFAQEQAAISTREDQRLAGLMTGLYAAGRASGAIPATTPPPPAPGIEDRNTWRREATEQDAAAREAIWRAAEAFEAGVGRSEHKYRG